MTTPSKYLNLVSNQTNLLYSAYQALLEFFCPPSYSWLSRLETIQGGTMSEYIPSPRGWVAEQVERYEGSGGTEGLTLRDTGLPVIIVTNRGSKTGAIRKTPLMRVVDGNNYILVASQGGAPKHPLWYHNLKADPNVEIRDKTEVYAMRVREVV